MVYFLVWLSRTTVISSFTGWPTSERFASETGIFHYVYVSAPGVFFRSVSHIIPDTPASGGGYGDLGIVGLDRS